MVKRKSEDVSIDSKLKYRKTEYRKLSKNNEAQKRLKTKSFTVSRNLTKNDFIGINKTLVCSFGLNDTGQLGIGENFTSASYPKVIQGLKFDSAEYITHLCAGGMHCLCLSSSNKLYSFGCPDDGALGRTSEGTEAIPEEVNFKDGQIDSIYAGDSFSCVFTKEKSIFMCGTFRDPGGMLGLINNHVEENLIKVYDNKIKPIIQVACGKNHMLLLNQFGEVFSFGSYEFGQLGRVAMRFCISNYRKGPKHFLEPNLVRFSKKGTFIREIFASMNGSFAVEQFTNQIYVWGSNSFHQLGCEPKEEMCGNEYFPIKVKWPIPNDIVQICGGISHTLILDTKGILYAMGRYEYGRLGLGNIKSDITLPTPIAFFNNMPPIIQISAGEHTSFAVNSKGDAFSWGSQTCPLANGNPDEDSWEPSKIIGKQMEDKRTIYVSTGGQHTLLLVTVNPC